MPVKQQHTEADIAALAEEFRKSWQEGQVLRSWLRIHAGELRHLVRHQDWAWVNIGKAMSLAGIAYRTGKPWTGEHLRRALVKACATRNEKPERRQSAQHGSSGETPNKNDGEPEFRIIRRMGTGAPMPRPDLSDEDIHAIAAGLKR